uniref:Dolichol-phosphate mannose synthase subunit 3 n=2 Tax=Steinernema glaseri TaxID=37863 RepID=A0A1I7YHQ2_9BILA
MASQLIKYSCVVSFLLTIWFCLPWDNVLIAYAPIIAIVLLGIYAVLSVLHGVATFNDCEYAKVSLQEEIKEARIDLAMKNLVMRKSHTSQLSRKRKPLIPPIELNSKKVAQDVSSYGASVKSSMQTTGSSISRPSHSASSVSTRKYSPPKARTIASMISTEEFLTGRSIFVQNNLLRSPSLATVNKPNYLNGSSSTSKAPQSTSKASRGISTAATSNRTVQLASVKKETAFNEHPQRTSPSLTTSKWNLDNHMALKKVGKSLTRTGVPSTSNVFSAASKEDIVRGDCDSRSSHRSDTKLPMPTPDLCTENTLDDLHVDKKKSVDFCLHSQNSSNSNPYSSISTNKRKYQPLKPIEMRCSTDLTDEKTLFNSASRHCHRLVPNVLRSKRTPMTRKSCCDEEEDDDKSHLTSKDLANEIEEASSSDDEKKRGELECEIEAIQSLPESQKKRKPFVYIRYGGHIDKPPSERKKKQYDPFEPKYKTPMSLKLGSILERSSIHRTFWRADNPSYQTLNVEHVVDLQGRSITKWGISWYNATFKETGRPIVITDKASNYAIPPDAKIYSPVKVIFLDIAKRILVAPQYVRSVKPPLCLDLSVISY